LKIAAIEVARLLLIFDAVYYIIAAEASN